MGIKIILVYFDSNKNEAGNEANKKIRRDVETLIENNEKEGLILLGDFNGHIKMIDGRDDDLNGKMLIDFMEKYNLNMLNMDSRCKGKYTWSQRGSKTTIDYILVNEKALESFQDMEIDEDKIMFSDSDHCILSAKFYFKGAEKQSFKKEEWKYFEYYRRDEEALSRYRGEVEKEWIEGYIENKQMEEQSLMMKAEEVLKKKTRKRVGAQEYVENVWMTDQIRKEIKVRRIINRRRRNAVGEEEKERLWKSYLRQKWKVQKLIREAKERHELEVTKEIKRKMREGRGGKKL